MKQKRVIPAFKSESEEAAWWYKNRLRLDKDFAETAKRGKLKRLDQATLKARSRFLQGASGFDPLARE